MGLAVWLACPAAPVRADEPLTLVLALADRAEDRQALASTARDLAAYLEARGLSVRVEALPGPAEAAKRLAGAHAAAALVDLPFYIQYARSLFLTPLANGRAGGFESDRWTILVRGEDADKPLSGRIEGTMLFSFRAGACLLLPGVHGGIVTLEGTERPLESLRRLRDKAPGGPSAVALDQVQSEALRGLPEFRGLAEAHATEPLPGPVLVWVGRVDKADEAGARLRNTLFGLFEGMSGDAGARAALRGLGMDGFVPPDKGLPLLLKACPE